MAAESPFTYCGFWLPSPLRAGVFYFAFNTAQNPVQYTSLPQKAPNFGGRDTWRGGEGD